MTVWITSRRTATRKATTNFWLNLLAIVVAIVNAFVHSRDAYVEDWPVALGLRVILSNGRRWFCACTWFESTYCYAAGQEAPAIGTPQW